MRVLGALLVLAGLEAFLRFFVPLPSVTPPLSQNIWRPLGNGLAQMSIGRRQVLRLRKPPSTYRIFMVGSSELQGAPLTIFESVPCQLQRRLSSRHDGRDYEVICAAEPSTDSMEQREYVRQIVDSLSPDCIFVVSGNSEFNRVRQQKAAQHWLALYAWMRYAWSRTLLDPHEYERATVTEADVAAARARYRGNLADMAECCKQRKVALIFCTVPANEMWCSPGAEHREVYMNGLRAVRFGAYQQAKTYLDAAMETDPRPQRALPSFADIVRSVAANYSAPVCPLIAALEVRSRYGILDNRWFFDNCHMKCAATALVPAFLEKTMAAAGLADRAHQGQDPPRPRQAWRLDTWPGAVEALDSPMRVSYDAHRFLQKCHFGYFAGRRQQVLALLSDALPSKADADTLIMAAHILFTNDMFEEAADYYQRALRMEPHDPVLSLDLGYAWWFAGRYREAVRAFTDSGMVDDEVRRCLSLAKDLLQEPTAAVP